MVIPPRYPHTRGGVLEKEACYLLGRVAINAARAFSPLPLRWRYSTGFLEFISCIPPFGYRRRVISPSEDDPFLCVCTLLVGSWSRAKGQFPRSLKRNDWGFFSRLCNFVARAKHTPWCNMSSPHTRIRAFLPISPFLRSQMFLAAFNITSKPICKGFPV